MGLWRPMETRYIEHYFTWIQSGTFNVGVDFAVDRLTAVMLLIVTGVGLLIHIYAIGYMAHEGGYYRFFAYLNLFMFFMLILVLAAELPAAVRGLGRRGSVQLPADRVLLPGEVRLRRGQQGLHRESHRRLRILAGDVPDRQAFRHRSTSAQVFGKAAEHDRPRRSRSSRSACCCCWARPASRRRFLCMSGCRMPWPARPPFPP